MATHGNRIAVQIVAKKNTLEGSQVHSVVCHRLKEDVEQYLVRWRTPEGVPASKLPYSWHNAEEFNGLKPLELYYLQLYVDSVRQQASESHLQSQLASETVTINSLKRKESPNSMNGPRPSPYHRASGSPAVNHSNGQSKSKDHLETRSTYNCRLQIDLENNKISVIKDANGVDTTLLPTSSMKQAALSAPTRRADAIIRERFLIMLKSFNLESSSPDDAIITIKNDLDASLPALNYNMVDDYHFWNPEDRPDPDFVVGCTSCRPHMGQNIGCEYTKLCECLEEAAVDEQRLQKDEEGHRKYQAEQAKKAADPTYIIDTSGLPKRFPYHKDGTLVSFYLNARHVVYECNHLCKCGPNCRTKVTINRRQVPLEIFKTQGRGWGLKCPKPLRKGQFVDFYYGELIPVEESERRLDNATKDKNSYVFALDKFHADAVDEETGKDIEDPIHEYDVDGEFQGGPSRYINHSCDPNCRQVVVSWCKHDYTRYNLALFAIHDIPAGTELTFDYVDLEEPEETPGEEDDDGKESVPCLCGAKNCRKWLWR